MLEVTINNLTKHYGKNEVLNNVNMTFDSNSYNFLVGENGSGKSTLIKCILDEINYQGEIDKKGYKIAYAPEKIVLPDYVTLHNFLVLLGLNKIKKIKEVNELIDYYLQIFNIEKYKNKLICELSKGTRQKIILIQTLMDSSDVYIFDEPLSGLDIESRKNFMEELKKLKRKSKIIIISTHYLNQYKFKYKKVFNFPYVEEVENGLNETT